MKPLFLSVIFSFFASCSTALRTTTPNVVEDTQVENPPFEIIDLTITPWVAGRKESGKGYMLKLILAQPFATLDSVLYVNASGIWKTEESSFKEVVYSANISEKRQHQNELILDANPVNEYGNQLPKFPKDQVMIYYRYNNKPQRYIHKKLNIKSTLLYM
ncbi:hypothetical protein OA336_01910 [Flavobacteriaceae bacterium]|nr:hypothetical protein [Flavobacteriaceae bacterium]